MDEDEFELRLALSERLLQPAILRRPSDHPQPSPPSRAGLSTGTGRARRTGHRPIPRRSNPPAGRSAVCGGVPGIKPVGHRIRKVAFAHQVRPDRQAVVRSVVIFAAFAIVGAQREKDRHGTTDLPEIVALRQILPGRLVAGGMLVGHEEVAEIDVEIGLVGPDVGQSPAIHVRAGVLIQMRIRRQGEGEAAARRPRRVKGVFLDCG